MKTPTHLLTRALLFGWAQPSRTHTLPKPNRRGYRGDLLWNRVEIVAARKTVLVVFDADVFENFAVGRPQFGVKTHVEWPGKRARIVDRHDSRQLRELGPRPPLDGVQLLGVRRAAAIEPELVVEADGVDDERVAIPASDRVAEPCRRGSLRMLPAVHEDLPEAVHVPF